MAPTAQKPGINTVKWWPSGDLSLNERLLFNAIADHDQAITTLSTMMPGASTAATTGVQGFGNVTVINNNTTFPGLGAVNTHTAVTPYTVQALDNGALVLVGDATPVTVNLDSALSTPYFTTISNVGSADVTIIPTTGTVNGVASLTLPGMSWVTVYYDGVNWQAESPGSSVGGVSQLIAGTNITLAPAGGTGVVTVNSTAGGSWAGSGSGWRTDTLGNLECWGLSTAASTGATRGTATITFPQTFSSAPIVTVTPDNDPDGSGNNPFSCYVVSVSTTGCTVNFACAVPTGGGGATILNVVHAQYRAIGPA